MSLFPVILHQNALGTVFLTAFEMHPKGIIKGGSGEAALLGIISPSKRGETNRYILTKRFPFSFQKFFFHHFRRILLPLLPNTSEKNPSRSRCFSLRPKKFESSSENLLRKLYKSVVSYTNPIMQK
ncbi:hypothetical protein JTE90_022309 [Oedothorax gibbosus]|uniref:Uncharacterized protein n=1 Tax=Oedothorax gibbosus TaxID=931172 RepID=A0AAV6VW05_9ARAC|nr:hypothetical protein JTE90_022309 [Oedothorax gibbosus]